MPPKGPDEGRKYTLTVRATSGRFEEQYSRSERVEKVLGDAMKRFHLADGPGITYLVVRERGNGTLSPAEKLAGVLTRRRDA